MLKNLILSFIASVALTSLVGCADDQRHSSSYESSSASMSVDSKDMNHPHQTDSH